MRTTIAGIVGGTASSLGGGKFSNGAISGAFVHMFNAEGGASSLVNNISKGVSYVANGVQFVAGATLTATGWGAILGVPMMAHASNNLYETYTGNTGILRNGEEMFGLDYDKVDIGVSLVSGVAGATRQVGARAINYGSNALKGYIPIRSYSTLPGKIDIGVTTSGIANTVYGMDRE